jgi:uncharacterized membrane protein YcaP (DUF421 family)
MASIFIRTIIIYILLTILLKLMGKRQIGELEVNELVSTLLISEIAAIPISDTNLPLLSGVVPIFFLATLEILLSALKNKSSVLKRAVEGEPAFIIYKGRLSQKELIKNRISINEILTEMRTQGIGSLSDIYYGILEQNGRLSLIETKDKDTLAHSLIIDGMINNNSLERLGHSEEWLSKELSKQGVRANDVFLYTITDSGEVNIILKEENK